jgi:small subunit ribosomal protein S9
MFAGCQIWVDFDFFYNVDILKKLIYVYQDKERFANKMVHQEKKVKLKTKQIIKLVGVPLAGATGRRKKAVARVWARRGTGKIVVNGLAHQDYFDTDKMCDAVTKPITVCHIASQYDFQINVFGGGKMGQSGAVKLAIARALMTIDPSVRPVLRQNDLITVDSRNKERKKYGQRGARRKFQFVKR